MKKVLLGTTALAVASFVGAQQAKAQFEVTVGGYMEQKFGYSSVDIDGTTADFDGFDVKPDSEIHFKAKQTLENGLTFGVDVQLEAETNTFDQIDESYLFIQGSFGQILLGSENSAGYKMTYAAPDVSFANVNSGDQTNWLPSFGLATTAAGYFRRVLGTTYLELDGVNDSNRVTYFTPRWNGLQLGASFTPDGAQDSLTQFSETRAFKNGFDIAANYVNSFDGFDVAVSGRYGFADDDSGATDSSPELWSVGLNLGYGGFTIGGSYAEANDQGVNTGESYDAGVSYTTGPWGASFTYFHGEAEGTVGLAGDEEQDAFQFAVSYAMGPGVTLEGNITHVEFDDDDGGAGFDDHATYGILGVKLSF
ncbi:MULTISPECIES: porin [Limibacillus]|jgi:predicted porin|uniref:Putative porin n=1 Tax=Limibacillus halophilus TaxID=1579333 RepID=A0A839SQ00_9PROT|nr:porin [Limibacillus halophilus]MBB3063924.1 putative porin [Limibacillus halophilus]